MAPTLERITTLVPSVQVSLNMSLNRKRGLVGKGTKKKRRANEKPEFGRQENATNESACRLINNPP